MKTVALVAYDTFTDIDLFLAWDLLKRVPELDVQIVAPTPTITSSTGVTISVHGGLERVTGADGVYVTSGAGSRAIAKDVAVLAALGGIEPGRQIVAAVDSGVLILAALGHLRGKRATTYPAPDLHDALASYGVERCDRALVVEGDLATAAQCLAGVDLVAWFVTRPVSAEAAEASVASVRRLAD
jgi:transcriptional regulator GlxA family with amidase domain